MIALLTCGVFGLVGTASGPECAPRRPRCGAQHIDTIELTAPPRPVERVSDWFWLSQGGTADSGGAFMPTRAARGLIAGVRTAGAPAIAGVSRDFLRCVTAAEVENGTQNSLAVVVEG